MRTHVSTRALGVVAAGLCLALTIYGCSGGGSSDNRLRVINFNLDGVAGAFLNERLIFTFTGPVDPDSVNIQTVQIRYDASRIDIDGDCFPDNPANTNAVPEGDFLVDGNRVIFQPRIPSSPTNDDIGLFPAHQIDTTPDPDNCDRNTDLIVRYSVRIPGFSESNPEVVVSRNDGKPNVATFNSSFTTVRDLTFPPSVSMDSFVDTVAGPPFFVQLASPTPGSTNVPLDTVVEAQFSEALLPSSVSADAVFLVGVGPRNGREERIPATFELDQLNGIVRLTPTIELPGNVEMRVKYSDELMDFGGNRIVVEEDAEFPSFFTAPAVTEGPFAVREEFDNQDNLDAEETSSLWNDPGSPGQLVAGMGGGTAVLGELVFDPEEEATMTFDTGDYDPANPFKAFEYSTIFIGEFATITATGENPLILKATQDIIIEGEIDIAGSDAASVLFGGTAGTPGGEGGPGGGNGGGGGSLEGQSGVTGQGARQPLSGARFPGGGGGSVARTCADNAETGGGGGGNFDRAAVAGRGDDNNGGGGGAAGLEYSIEAMSPFNGTFTGGSGGGGAGATCVDGITYPGSGGGGGGGGLWLHAGKSIELGEDIRLRADGGAGGDNLFFEGPGGSIGGACGGGGSGGGILMEAVESLVGASAGASLSAGRGSAGTTEETGGNNDGGGGAGGFGRFYLSSANVNVFELAFQPSPFQGPYRLDGQTAVGTSTWFDSGAFFPDYTYVQGPRNGGPTDQDNANLFPNATSVIQYWFQGAPPDPEDPTQPDLDNLRPGVGEFATSIDEVDDSQFIRVKVVFTYPVPMTGVTPFSNFFQFSYIYAGGRSLTEE